MEVQIDEGWKEVLSRVLASEHFKELAAFIESEYTEKKVYPEAKNIFKALNLTPLSEVKVVILGQDPYPREGEADGLCFSVGRGSKIPAGLRNIFKEIRTEFNRDSMALEAGGSLEAWAEQGVLLLNSILTVEKGKPGSHRNIGWEKFTDEIIKKISEKGGVVFMLWGAKAKQKEILIDKNRNLVLKANHPSQPSRLEVFAGNGHFLKANQWLREHGKTEIVW